MLKPESLKLMRKARNTMTTTEHIARNKVEKFLDDRIEKCFVAGADNNPKNTIRYGLYKKITIKKISLFRLSKKSFKKLLTKINKLSFNSAGYKTEDPEDFMRFC